MCATSRSLGWLLLFVWQQAVPAPPLLTGIVEDAESQAVEMPRLPGAWQRRIEWMAPEGSTVSAGDLIVRLDPGTMIVQEEQARTDLENRMLLKRWNSSAPRPRILRLLFAMGAGRRNGFGRGRVQNDLLL